MNNNDKQQQILKPLIDKKVLRDVVLKNKDGFTYSIDLKPSKFKRGYYVSITNNNNNDLNKAIDNLNKIYAENLNKDNRNFLFIGGWIDEQDKTFYLDLSLHLNNKQNALFIAKLFKQKAIWDIKNLKEIRL
jgi:predicted RNA-binding protein YlxR (DUF448 family)